MKRLLFILLVSSSYLLALTPQQETDFVKALASGNIDEIKAQLAKGATPNYQFTIPGYKGHTPISIVSMENIPLYELRNNMPQLKQHISNKIKRMEVLRFLISRGADRAILNMNAKAAIAAGDDIMALYWVDAGATGQDLIKGAQAQLAKETHAGKKIVWSAIITKLENVTGKK